MPRDYAAFTTLVTQKLQSSGSANFSVSEVDNQIEECLKEFSSYQSHLVPVIFKIEGRYGTASSTSADNLIDTPKGHFVSGDPADEKIIHNITDNSRAVILTQASTAQVGLSSDIMTNGDFYKVYNRFCWNQRQVYIGDVPEYVDIHSVEYPIGTKRSFKLYDKVLEVMLKAGVIPDTNSNTAKVSNLPNTDILVRFKMPHQLSQLTDWTATFSATAAATATSIAATALQGAGTIKVGSELTIENHRTTYLVTASTTIASSAVTIPIYPGLESVVASTAWVITIRKSSLQPQQEDTFADLVAARLAINKSPKFIRSIAISGNWDNWQTWGERRLGETLAKLRRGTPPKTRQSEPWD